MTRKHSRVTYEVIRDLNGRRDIRNTDALQCAIDHLKRRDEAGLTKFGQELGVQDDPRNWVTELNEEVLDACQYAKAEILRRDQKGQRTVGIVSIYQKLLGLLVDVEQESATVKNGRFNCK